MHHVSFTKRLMYIAVGHRVITVIYCSVDDITMRKTHQFLEYRVNIDLFKYLN